MLKGLVWDLGGAWSTSPEEIYVELQERTVEGEGEIALPFLMG